MSRRTAADFVWPLAVFGALAFVPRIGVDVPKLFDDAISSPGTLQLLALCYWVIDINGFRRWAWPFEVFGVNALALFVGSGLMVKLMGLIKIPQSDGTRIGFQGWIFRHLFLSWATPINASLAYAIAFILLWLFLMWLLYRKRIIIKV